MSAWRRRARRSGAARLLAYVAHREAREARAVQQGLPALQAQLGSPLPLQATADAQARQLTALRQEEAALQQLQRTPR